VTQSQRERVLTDNDKEFKGAFAAGWDQLRIIEVNDPGGVVAQLQRVIDRGV
jgi:hypothetical protein